MGRIALGGWSLVRHQQCVQNRSIACRRNRPAHHQPVGKTVYYRTESEDRVKPLRWTSHALEALADRDIDRAEVDQTLAAPELLVVTPPRRAVLMRRYFDVRLESQMLLRVVVEEAPDERVVIRVYKTSRIAKYLERTMP